MYSTLQSAGHSLRRVFLQGFTVMDLAVPLISFDSTADAEQTRRFMQKKKLQIIGVRTDGHVTGVIGLGDIPKTGAVGPGRDAMQGLVLDSSATLAETVTALRDAQRVMVSILGHVGAIVSRTDIEKPPARMWLFGMVTLIEMRYSRMVDVYCPDDSWQEYLSEGRVALARELQAERSRRQQGVDLLSCLQFSDKMQIVARNAELRAKTSFQSRRQVDLVAKLLQKLRNNLAHSQSIVSDDWETIQLLTEHLDIVLEGPPGLE
jgi:hypothetical protein